MGLTYEQVMGMTAVLDEVMTERHRQHEKFGLQHHLKDFDPTQLFRPLAYRTGIGEDRVRARTEARFADGRGTWADVLAEEVAEAIEADTQEHLAEELIQVAAVAVAWVEAIRARV